jgi:hypothetical protein
MFLWAWETPYSLKVVTIMPAIAPAAETIILPISRVDRGKSPFMMVPSTRLAKLSLVTSNINLPTFSQRWLSLLLFTCLYGAASKDFSTPIFYTKTPLSKDGIPAKVEQPNTARIWILL